MLSPWVCNDLPVVHSIWERSVRGSSSKVIVWLTEESVAIVMREHYLLRWVVLVPAELMVLAEESKHGNIESTCVRFRLLYLWLCLPLTCKVLSLLMRSELLRVIKWLVSLSDSSVVIYRLILKDVVVDWGDRRRVVLLKQHRLLLLLNLLPEHGLKCPEHLSLWVTLQHHREVSDLLAFLAAGYKLLAIHHERTSVRHPLQR